MSPYQTASLAILTLGIALFVLSAPVLRIAARGHAASAVAHESELIVWITRILGVIIAMLGFATYLQS